MEQKIEAKNENNSVKIHTRKKTKYLIKRSDGLYEKTGLGTGFQLFHKILIKFAKSS